MVNNKFEAYNKEVMKRFLNPKFSGEIKNPDVIGETMNDKCGDKMRVFLKVGDNDKIKDIKFQTLGCAAAIASSDALCELAKGKTLKQARKIKKQDILKKLKSLPNLKVHCSVLGEKTLHKAIEKYEKEGKQKNE
jgi:NifU-like protein involved in Fe-S cluster formation